ncbi:formate dehydrogenase subunit gamma [Actimicrobium sp. CCC2.4]|uniref:formate dehydrogenase subunit gamma n=1 Tax=Actimicrobium sp. CCC2.4 TaxID=3048606 RepID=UPI002AC98214|nr:formate dehydrogenase subunit gamma [Actimicrobium sp. CCC2.4]MEB0137253.1 formate dehydrogenase subunit gamma [Actimicrobium sp. CCC2.4]WPX33481.1 formate dehydrogenase subunit gamma [Actimicrobium sp. CCC2.4]
MKYGIARLVVGLSLAAAVIGSALAQQAAPAPVTTGGIESIDILKQNQAERTRDQPGNSAPVFRTIKEGTKNYSSLPALESGVLIQGKQQFPGQARATTAGEAWRLYRNGPLTLIGGSLLLLAAIGVAGVYFVAGPVKLKASPTGRLIERFTSIERLAHWSTAISFVLLAVSGLILLFGKHILLPVFGHTLFGWLSFACKNAHNFAGPVFTVSLVVTFIIFVKDNFPAKEDLQWLFRLGGMFGGKHASSGRFNAGEKLWFWSGVVVLGLIISASGFVLNKLVPGMDYPRSVMQIANVIHLIAAVLVSTMAMGHIYIGSIGMEGAYKAMSTGYVDDAWAKEHHDLWYADIEAGKVPRNRTEEAAERIQVPQPRSAT